MKDNRIVFTAKIAKMKKNRIIWIPQALHTMTKKLEGKTLEVVLQEVSEEETQQ